MSGFHASSSVLVFDQYLSRTGAEYAVGMSSSKTVILPGRACIRNVGFGRAGPGHDSGSWLPGNCQLGIRREIEGA
jgi:hypothetical protein